MQISFTSKKCKSSSTLLQFVDIKGYLTFFSHGKMLLYNQSLLSLQATVRESRPRNAANKHSCIRSFLHNNNHTEFNRCHIILASPPLPQIFVRWAPKTVQTRSNFKITETCCNLNKFQILSALTHKLKDGRGKKLMSSSSLNSFYSFTVCIALTKKHWNIFSYRFFSSLVLLVNIDSPPSIHFQLRLKLHCCSCLLTSYYIGIKNEELSLVKICPFLTGVRRTAAY